MNKRGFTLVEVISVIVIIGVLMLIAIPAVSNYIMSSRRASYAANVHAFVETINGKYDSKDYGSYVKDDEVMVIPFKTIELEVGDNDESPFGPYDFTKSYVLILTEYNKYQIYVNAVDSTGTGILMRTVNELSKENVDDNIATEITPWTNNVTGAVFTYKSKNYSLCETRYKGADDTYSVTNEETGGDEPVLILCEE